MQVRLSGTPDQGPDFGEAASRGLAASAVGRPRPDGRDLVGRVEHAEPRLPKEIGVLHTPYEIPAD